MPLCYPTEGTPGMSGGIPRGSNTTTLGVAMPEKPIFNLEELNASYEGTQPAKYVYRARVPGGWLIFTYPEMKGLYGVTFYPDPNHAWDGGTQPGGT
jgi:hypothetical protein